MILKEDKAKAKKEFREEISRKLDLVQAKKGLAKAKDLKEIIADFKKLIKISDLKTVQELKKVVIELEKEVDEIVKVEKDKAKKIKLGKKIKEEK
jgi:divalent metal cation (Fe/Co/Zn/Cd) transporter